MQSSGQMVLFVLAIPIVLLIFLVLVLFFCFLRVWVKALLAKCPIQLFNLIAMRLRGNSPGLIVDALIVLRSSGVDVSVDEVERVYMANKHNLRRRGDKQRQARELVELVEEGRDSPASDPGS